MTDKDIFYRFSPFIQEYIYNNGWQELREVQALAAKVIFESDDNLLLTSGTASGKTEAAFFPIISELYENMPSSIGVLYIAPLKSLINDQFSRLDEILDLSGIPVFHWHGDVAASHKNKLLKNPSGILQITPESLESMLMNRSNDIVRLFGDLRYVVIDEIHTMTGTDRGNQIICQLVRIARLIGHEPRRIGLSATVGDREIAAQFLGGGTNRQTVAPETSEGVVKWKLGIEHFYLDGGQAEDICLPPKNASLPYKTEIDPRYEYIYECVKNKKAIIFSNSREETEYVTATMRQIAENRGDEDRFLIHHGNLSASIREETELKMKDDEHKEVACATVTMELGIDIGRLERVIQNDAPNSVSGFLQRLGRSGRRGAPPEMMMVFGEENPIPNTPLPELIPWGLLRAIAIVQLYLEEKFIEPPFTKKLPYSLAFQQTLSILASSGELMPKVLAERVLSLPPFLHIPKEDYKAMLVSMLKNEFLELTEDGGIIIGLRGEKLINSFKFYAVFKDSEDYTVRCESDEIGTITAPLPIGDRFALAGRVWEVSELDIPRHLIYVKSVKGKMEVSWPGDFGEIHTRILERMRDILSEDTVYPYLKPNAKNRIQATRALAKSTGIAGHSLVCLGGYTWCLFPWLGTRSFRTMRKFILSNAHRFGISGMEFEGCYYMTFKMEYANGKELISALCDIVRREGVDCTRLVGKSEAPAFEKYDDYLPSELLRRQYYTDKLRPDEVEKRLFDILNEFKD